MPQIKTPEEIAILKEGGKILGSILNEVALGVAPGIKTKELNEYAERLILKNGAEPSFKGYKNSKSGSPYPASLCTSVNDEVVHGIPGEYALKEGDILGLDLGIKFKGLHTDAALTVPVGNIERKTLKLLEATKRALFLGTDAVKDGAYTGDVGFCIQSYVESMGFGVVKELVGHGVGYRVHEEPEVPNWGRPGRGEIFKKGMVIALEPMAILGSGEVELKKDGWTWKTKDGSPAAHFEHTLVVTKNGREILTPINFNV